LLDVLTSNGDSINITAGEKLVSYKKLGYVKWLRVGLINSLF